jgi:DNA-binding transcriptional ArsR family regulator
MQAPAIEVVRDNARAAALLHPLRRRILEALREPDSAAGLARRFRLPRQKINYHVRELARTHFLERAGRRRCRNMTEQRYMARAAGYMISPEILGRLNADKSRVEDVFSASYLLAVSAQLQSELGRAAAEAETEGKRLATMSLISELRFESAQQRAAFAKELQRALTDVVARFSSPYARADGSRGAGRPYRLMMGCYPIPPSSENSGAEKNSAEKEN